MTRICTIATAAVATAVLLSWGIGQWRAGAFGAGYIPMAPSTALGLLLLTFALTLNSRRAAPRSHAALGALMAAAVGAFALMVLARPWLDLAPLLERWLSGATDSVGNVPVGQMSPLTALAFLVACGGLLCLLPPLSRFAVSTAAGGALSVATILVGLAVALGYASGTPFLYGGPTIPMALATAASFVLTGLGLAAAHRVHDVLGTVGGDEPSAPAPGAGRQGRSLFLAFALLAAGLAGLGVFYLRRQTADVRLAALHELAAIADLKVAHIANWRRERLGDARLIQETRPLVSALQAHLEDPGAPGAGEGLQVWMDGLRSQYGYCRVELLDRDGRIRMASPRDAGTSSGAPARGDAGALTGMDVVVSDLRQDASSGLTRMAFLVPIPGAAAPAGAPQAPVGLVILEVDASSFLFPLVQEWPTPSPTAETLLVRRDGEDVLFLNDLRHRHGTALRLRLPASSAALPAALATRGDRGSGEGVDYRGVPVLATTRTVPNSPWALVAKIDQSEIFRPLRVQAMAAAGVVTALLVAAALGVGLIQRRRDAVVLRRELGLERQRKAAAERLGQVMRHANDGILLLDRDWRILEANERALTSYGYDLPELLRLTLPDLRAPEAQAAFPHQAEELVAEGRAVLETVHRRKDGTTFPVEVSTRVVHEDGGTLFLAIVRDTSERKAAEARIRRLNRLLRTISEINQLIVRESDRDRLLAEACRIAVEHGGFHKVSVAVPAGGNDAIRVVASASEPAGGLAAANGAGTETSVEEALFLRAIRGGDPVVIGVAPPGGGPAGPPETGAIGAFPFRVGGRVEGAFMVSSTPGLGFDAEEVDLLRELAGDLGFSLGALAVAEDLRDSEKRLRTTLDTMLEGCQIIGRDWTYLYVNDTAAAHGQLPRERLIGHTMMEAYPGIEGSALWAELQASMAGRKARFLENEFVYSDGSRSWFELGVQPVPEGLFILSIDISERKRREREVEALTQRLEYLTAAVQELASARDIAAIGAVIRRWARLLSGADGVTFVLREGDSCHYVDEDAIGPLLKGQRFPMEACISGWAMLHRQAVVVEDVYADARIPLDAYRPTFVKSLAMVPIRTPDPIGAMGAYWAEAHVPTDRELRLLQALADATSRAIENVRLYDELEDRVRQRTGALEAANRELEAFSYSVSHDLRAPLRAIDGFSQLVEEEYGPRLDAEGARLLGVIRTNARRMGHLIDDLLALSRAGRHEMNVAPIDMAALASAALDELIPPDARDTFVLGIDALLDCVGDAGLVRQVWVNLLSNAVKFSAPRSRPSIEIACVAEGTEVVYCVKDNGVGFDMKFADKLFGVFQRLHPAREFEGTGIGLALVQRIVHRHGGRVWAHGKPGEGATFYFTLPGTGGGS